MAPEAHPNDDYVRDQAQLAGPVPPPLTFSAEDAAGAPDAAAGPADEDLANLHRNELDARARALGVEGPEKLENKDAVIAAIDEQKAASG